MPAELRLWRRSHSCWNSARADYQVEYRPRRKYRPLEEPEGIRKEFGAADDSLANPDDAELYFSDRLESPSAPLQPPPPPPSHSADGYLQDPHPSWQLKDDPDISRSNGVWGMIRRIRATPSEGLPGLWKGTLLTTAHGVLSTLLQPYLHAVLCYLPGAPPLSLDFPLSALPNPLPAFGLQVASSALTSFILSPIELIRTRLIVQPGSHPSAKSSIGLLRSAVRDEGGVAGLWTASNVLLPSLLESILRPALTMAIPLVIERQLRVSPDLSPVMYSALDLGLNIAALLVLLPVETVRKRLQVQPRGKGAAVKSVVAVRERPYIGIVEAIYRIVTEETSRPRKRVMEEKDEGGLLAGVGQLYRGLGMAVTTHLTVFGLGLITTGLGGGGVEQGWKEF